MPYNLYEVIEDIPNVKKGKSIPWFGQPGMGVQYEFVGGQGIDFLLKKKMIKPVK